MPFIITPLQKSSILQQKDDIELSARAHSGKHSPASSIQQSPRSQKLSPLKVELFPLPQLQSHTLPKTPMPRQPPELPDAIRDSQPSNSDIPPNSTSATDKGKITHFATKTRKTYKRNDPNTPFRKL